MRVPDAEERAYNQILSAIADQKYAPGDHLIETKVADDLNMSRTPVRNALKKLIASGMLEYSPNVGCKIPVLTPHDMENVFLTRILLEAQAAELAAKRATDIEIERLFELLHQEKEFYSQGKSSDYTKVNELLHLGIAGLAKNSYLARFISQAFWRAELYIFFFDRFYFKGNHPGRIPNRDPNESQSCREHDALIGAIAAGKPDEAAAAMRAHVKSTYDTITRRVSGPPCA